MKKTTSSPVKLGKGFVPSTDKTPRYTVKEAADMMGLTTYTVRYYDNAGLIPGILRGSAGSRLFSDYTISWLRLIHCLRTTGLSIEGVKNYVDLCLQGDSTIPQRAELIFKQEKVLRQQIQNLNKQMEVLKYKKTYYENLLANHQADQCNPAGSSSPTPMSNGPIKQEPNIVE